MSKKIQNHVWALHKPSSVVSNTHQSSFWKELYGPFHGDPRGLVLSLCADGVNPFAKENVQYSMCPITHNFKSSTPYPQFVWFNDTARHCPWKIRAQEYGSIYGAVGR